MDSEEWRPVLGYEGYYEVSSLGRVRSLPRIRSAKRRKGTQFTMRMAGRVLVLCLNKSGYLAGNMCIEGQRKNFEVRSEEHTSELQSLMRTSYAVFCLKKTTTPHSYHTLTTTSSLPMTTLLTTPTTTLRPAPRI